MPIPRPFGRRRQDARRRGLRTEPAAIETLEARLLLSAAPAIESISSPHDGFRFIAGQGVPAVANTYQAAVTGDVTSVAFSVGGMSLTDSNPLDGFSATFDMTQATSVAPLTVTASGPGGSDVDSHAVDLLMLPAWLSDAETEFSATHDWTDGYAFDVTVEHYREGFYTPQDWQLTVPVVDVVLLDLAGKWTGFEVESAFTLTSLPDGTVLTSGYELGMAAHVLDEPIFEETFALHTSDTIDYEWQGGGVTVSGTVDYGAELNPFFDNNLMLAGISGTAWIDPTLTATMPLGQARVPLLSIPGAADAVFGADATVEFGCDAGNMLIFTPTVSGGGFGLQQLEFHPEITVGITGYGEVQVLLGAGTAGASLTGELTQGVDATYTSGSGWSVSAPGSLTLSGNVYYSTLWGFGPSGELDLFNWEVANWDFLDDSGDSGYEESHAYEDATLLASWDCDYLGYDGQDVEFLVDYNVPGSSPQAARLILDEAGHDMVLASGSPASGTYRGDVSGLSAGEHEVAFIFIDNQGDYHVTQTLVGLTDDAYRGNHSAADSQPINRLSGTYADLVLVADAAGVGLEDWFSFYLPDEAEAGDEVVLAHDAGSDVDLTVYDASLSPVGAMSYPDATTEVCGLAGLPGDLYYIRVRSTTGEPCRDYDLSLSVGSPSPVTVVEVIDRSGSMSDSSGGAGGTKMEAAKNAARLFIDLMDAGDKIGVVSYSSSARTDFALTEIPRQVNPPEPQTLFSHSMDDQTGWLADAPWGLDGSLPHSAPGCLTDSPVGSYGNYVDASLTLAGAVSLPAGEPAGLTFWTHYELESGYDYGHVEVSADGGASWQSLATLNGSQGSWTEESYSLAAYAGQDVLIRFRLTTDGSVTRDGWYLDDVTIRTGVVDGGVKAAARAAVDALGPESMTSIGAGVREADTQLDRFGGDAVRAMIVMTDGLQNTSPEPIGIIQGEVDSDIRIYTVGFGSDADELLLQEMAGLRNGSYCFAATEEDLQRIYRELAGDVSGMQTILEAGGVIYPGQSVQEAVDIDASVTQVTIGVSWPGSDLDLVLIAPDGRLIDHAAAAADADIQLFESGTYELYKISGPMPGQWDMRVQAVDVDAGGENYELYAMVDSVVTATATTDRQDYAGGEAVTIRAQASDGMPIVGASVQATVMLPDGSARVVVLYDDGYHGDGSAGDGTYANRFTETYQQGAYTADVEIAGTTRGGFDFVRTPSASFEVTSSAAMVVKPFGGRQKAEFLDANGDLVTVSLKGDGHGEVRLAAADGVDAMEIVVFGTTDRSSLQIKTKGRGSETTVGGITVYGSIGSLVGKTTDLAGRLQVDGSIKKLTLDDVEAGSRIDLNAAWTALNARAITLTLDRVADAAMDAHGLSIKSLTVGQWLDTGPADWITAASIGRLKTRRNTRSPSTGDFEVSLRLDGSDGARRTLGGATIAGGAGGEWDIIGHVGAVKIAGGVDDWHLHGNGLLASVRSLSLGVVGGNVDVDVNGALGTVKAKQWAGGSITADSLKSLRIAGDRRLGLAGHFGADLTLRGHADPRKRTLGAAKIAGVLTDATIDVVGDAGAIAIASSTGACQAAFSGDVRSLTAKGNKRFSLPGDLRGQWTASAMRSVSVAGSLLDARIALNQFPEDRRLALGKLNVKRWIDGARITSRGHVGSIAAGAVRDFTCFAGLWYTADANGDGVLDLPDPATALNVAGGPARIGKLTVKGLRDEGFCVINSNIAAAEIGSVSIAYPQTENNDEPFGLAADFIGRLKVKEIGGTESGKNLHTPGDAAEFCQDDAEVRLI